MKTQLGPRARRTREHILAQGMALMKEKGFRATTIRDICEAAEVSVGTFYMYFRDKGELFRYNFAGMDSSFAEFLAGSITGDTTTEKIMSFVRYYAWLNIGTGREQLEEMFLRPGNKWFPGDNPIYHLLYRIVSEGQADGELTDGIEAERIVDMIRVYMRGCVYDWLMGGRAFDLEERTVDYVGQLIASLTVR